jgi:hypothetical protein
MTATLPTQDRSFHLNSTCRGPWRLHVAPQYYTTGASSNMSTWLHVDHTIVRLKKQTRPHNESETKKLHPLEQTCNQNHTRYMYFQHTCTTRTTSNFSQIHTGVHARTSANTYTDTHTHDVRTYITAISSSITYSHNRDTYALVHTQTFTCTLTGARVHARTHANWHVYTGHTRPQHNTTKTACHTQWYSLTR